MGLRENEQLLHSIHEQLTPRVDLAEVRGAGMGSFLYAVRGGRAVEVSVDELGHIWMEYWEASADENAPPVRDDTFDSAEAQPQVPWRG